MANPIERYKNLVVTKFLLIPYKYPSVCEELGAIIRFYFSKFPKPLQSILFDDTLFAFRLLPQMQTQSAVSAATFLIQSVVAAFPKQKRALAAAEFKQAKIAYKRRGKVLDDKDPVYLPQDVLVDLFCFLDPQSLLTAGLVCRSWNAAANDSHLWQIQYTNHFGDSDSIPEFEDVADSNDEGKQHAPSSDLCSNANTSWKDAFQKAYLGIPKKFDRGFCLFCESIIWVNNLKCPNQLPDQTAREHQLKKLSPSEIGRYILYDFQIAWLLGSDGTTDDDSESDEGMGFFPRIRIWDRW